MTQDEEAVVLEEKADLKDSAAQNKNLIVIFVCTALSMFSMKTGLLTFFFLVPLGCAVLLSGSVINTFIIAAGINIVISVFLHSFVNHNVSLLMDILYFTAIIFIFIWITGGSNVRTAYRFLAGAAAGALAFFIFIISNRNNDGFNLIMNEMAQVFASMLGSTVNDNDLRQVITADRVLELIKVISLRGGAIISMLIMFFINWLLTCSIIKFIRRNRQIRQGFGIKEYFAPSNSIWILPVSIAVILLTRSLKMEIVEILTWNVFTVCVILFLVQGAGILMFLLSKKSSIFRIAAYTAIILVLFSPLNTIAFFAILLLGILEIWLPLRRKEISMRNE